MKQIRTFTTSVLVALSLSFIPLDGATQENNPLFKTIDPFVANTDKFGNSMSLPKVSINEYSGRVSSTIGSYGVGNLALSLSYGQNASDIILAREETQELPFGNAGYTASFNFSLGYLSVDPYKRTPVASEGHSREDGNNLQISLVENGSATSFYRDTVFQSEHPNLNSPLSGDYPDTCLLTNWNHRVAINELYQGVRTSPLPCFNPTERLDNHFLDDSGRRLQRNASRVSDRDIYKVSNLFGKETYSLINNSGVVTDYYPASDNLTFASNQAAYYYPVTVTYPNGQAIHIKYNGVGEHGLIQTDVRARRGEFKPTLMTDSYGRGLVVHYFSGSGFNDGKVEAITLESKVDNSDSERPDIKDLSSCRIDSNACKILATFSYSDSQSRSELSVSTPEGATTKYTFDKVPSGASFHHLLRYIDLDTGGRVVLNYELLTFPKIYDGGTYTSSGARICNDNTSNNCYSREDWYQKHQVTSAIYQGMLYEFEYRPAEEADLVALQELVSGGDHYKLFVVNVTGRPLISGSELAYQRTSFYFHQSLYPRPDELPPGEDEHYLVGIMLAKHESFTNELGENSQRSETFGNSLFKISDSECFYDYPQYNGKEHKTARLTKHRIKQDGRWLVNEYRYAKKLIDNPSYDCREPNYLHTPFLERKTRYYEGLSSRVRSEHRFTYDDNYFDVAGSIDYRRSFELKDRGDDNYRYRRLGALQTARIYQLDNLSGTTPGLQLIGQYYKQYEFQSMRPDYERNYTDRTSYYQRDFDYQDFGKEHGIQLEESHISYHGANVSQEYPVLEQRIIEYQYGEPRIIDLPDSGIFNNSEVVKNIRFDGSLESQTQFGLKTNYKYDDDGRIIESLRESFDSYEAPSMTRYNQPLNSGELDDYPDNFHFPVDMQFGGWSTQSKTGEDSAQRETLTILDKWGREAYSASIAASQTQPSTKTSYSPIGHSMLVVNPEGTRTRKYYDVWNRVTRSDTFDENQNKLNQLDYYVNPLSLGRTESIIQKTNFESTNSNDSRLFVKHSVNDFFGRPLKIGSQRNVRYSSSQQLELNNYTRFEYEIEPTTLNNITYVLPDCVAGDNNECVASEDRKRTISSNWVGQKLSEVHPEIRKSNFIEADECASTNEEDLTRFEYGSNGLISRAMDPLGTTIFNYYPSSKISKVTREECGNTETIREFTYDVNHQLRVSFSGDSTNSSTPSSHFDYDDLGRVSQVTRDIPMPSQPPIGQLVTEHSNTIEFNWTGNSDSYILELKKNELQPIVFDILNNSHDFELTRETFRSQVIHRVENDQEIYLADLNDNNFAFLKNAASYSWRLIGISSSFEPTKPSPWLPLNDGVLKVTPDELNFGEIVFGTSVTRTLNVRNPSNEDQVITSISVPEPFFSQSEGLTIEAGSNTPLRVSFSPTRLEQETSTFTEDLILTTDAGEDVAVSLSGTGISSSEFALQITSSKTELVAVSGADDGRETVQTTLTISNLSDQNISGGTITVSLPDNLGSVELSSSTYDLASAGNSTDTKQIVLTFQSGDDAGIGVISLGFNHSGENQTHNMPLTVVTEPLLGVLAVGQSTSQLSFGVVYPNEQKEKTVLIRNASAHGIITNLEYRFENDDGSINSEFSIVPTAEGIGGACERILPNKYCHAKVRFSPNDFGQYAANLILERQEYDSSGSEHTKRIAVRLTGELKRGAIVSIVDNERPNIKVSSFNWGIKRLEEGASTGVHKIVKVVNFGDESTDISMRIIQSGNSFRLGAPMQNSRVPPAEFDESGQIRCGSDTEHECGYLSSTIYLDARTMGRHQADLEVTSSALPEGRKIFPLSAIVSEGELINWSDRQAKLFPEASRGEVVSVPLSLINNIGVGVHLTGVRATNNEIFESVSISTVANGNGSSDYISSNGTNPQYDALSVRVGADTIGMHEGEICLEYGISGEICESFRINIVEEIEFYYDENFTESIDSNDRIKLSPIVNDREYKVWGKCTPVSIKNHVPSSRQATLTVEAPFYLQLFDSRHPYKSVKGKYQTLNTTGVRPFGGYHDSTGLWTDYKVVQLCAPTSAAGHETQVKVEVRDKNPTDGSAANFKEYLSRTYFVPSNDIEVDFTDRVSFGPIKPYANNVRELIFTNLSEMNADLRFEYDSDSFQIIPSAHFSVPSGNSAERHRVVKEGTLKNLSLSDTGSSNSSQMFILSYDNKNEGTLVHYIKIYNASGGTINGKPFDYVRVAVEQEGISNTGITFVSSPTTSISYDDVHVNEIKRGTLEISNSLLVPIDGYLRTIKYVSPSSGKVYYNNFGYFRMESEESSSLEFEIHIDSKNIIDNQYNNQIQIVTSNGVNQVIPVSGTVSGEPIRFSDSFLSEEREGYATPSTYKYYDEWKNVIGRTPIGSLSTHSISVVNDGQWSNVNSRANTEYGTHVANPSFEVGQVDYIENSTGDIRIPIQFEPQHGGEHVGYLRLRNGERVYKLTSRKLLGYALAPNKISIEGVNIRNEVFQEYSNSDGYRIEPDGSRADGYSPHVRNLKIKNVSESAIRLAFEKVEDSLARDLSGRNMHWWLNSIGNNRVELTVEPGETIDVNPIFEECERGEYLWFCGGLNETGVKIYVDNEYHSKILLRAFGHSSGELPWMDIR